MPNLNLLRPVWVGLANESDREKVLDFFAVFARFEHALKMGGFLKGAEGKSAEPHWEKFISQVENYQPTECEELNFAIELLVDSPPRRQLVEDGKPTFEVVATAPQGGTRFAQAVRSAKRVRNNLFHGGKYMANGESEERNRHLIASSVVILSAAIKVDQKVERHFHSY